MVSLMETLITKHSKRINELEEKNAQTSVENENLKTENENLKIKNSENTELFKFHLSSRQEKFGELEGKVTMLEEQIRTLTDENARLVTESTKIILTTSMEKLLNEDNEAEMFNINTSNNFVLLAENSNDKWEDFQLVTEVSSNSCEQKDQPGSQVMVNHNRKMKKESSKAKMHRLVKNVHTRVGKRSWNSKSILIGRNEMKNRIDITCPQCSKQISTSPRSDSGNFSVYHYKKHILTKH